ncbi:MAG TPA: tetratricopeptide repeat protein [Candidatus Angelobacter sp.]
MSSGRLSLFVFLTLAFVMLGRNAAAQENQDNQPHIQPRVDPNTPSKADKRKKVEPPAEKTNAQQETAPSAEEAQGESSSKDSQIDLNAHPLNAAAGTRTPEDANAYPWDPHRAQKDIEVGNYYLRHKNYRAALERFRDALLYKPNDAEATFGLATTQEGMQLFAQAYKSYSKYLDILPDGPLAPQAKDAMKRIEPQIDKSTVEAADSVRQAARALEQGENFLARNDYDAARVRFEDAARLTPGDPLVYFRLAQSLQGLQRLDPARMYYKKYLELQPAGPFAGDAKRQIQQISDVLGK